MRGRVLAAFRAACLRFLRRPDALPAHTLEAPAPIRQVYAPDALARVVAFYPADAARAWPTFRTADGQRHSLPRGLDAVILEAADGGRAVVFTGRAGRLDFAAWADPPGFRVPPLLWPAFHTALSGEDIDLPPFAVGLRVRP